MEEHYIRIMLSSAAITLAIIYGILTFAVAMAIMLSGKARLSPFNVSG